MNIVKLLERYRRNKQTAAILEYQLEEMIAKGSDTNIDHDTVLDYRHRPEGAPLHIIGFNQHEYDRKRKKLRQLKNDIKAAEIWVGEIRDDLTREVFEAFYLQGWSWSKIADVIGYAGNEDYPRKCIRDTYLKQAGVK